MKRFIFAALAVLATAFAAMAGDVPPERAQVVDMVKVFLSVNWPILAGWLISEIIPFLPGPAGGMAHWIKLWLDAKKQAGKARLSGMLLLLAFAVTALWLVGCQSIHINSSCGPIGAAGGKQSTNESTKQDGNNVSPSLTATLPLK